MNKKIFLNLLKKYNYNCSNYLLISEFNETFNEAKTICDYCILDIKNSEDECKLILDKRYKVGENSSELMRELIKNSTFYKIKFLMKYL